MFKNYLILLNFKIIKYKQTLIYKLNDLYAINKINHFVFHNNKIQKKYWLLMKYYAYLLNFS